MKPPMFLIIAVALILLSISLSAGVVSAADFAEEDSRIIISNDSYEIALDSTNGSIRYITDKLTNSYITENPSDGRLFWLTVGINKISSTAYKDGFKYHWTPSAQELTLTYTGTVQSRPNVEVKLDFSDKNLIKVSSLIDNTTSNPVTSFSFPGDLRFASSDIRSALLPMLPGVKLGSGFFTDRRSYQGLYPGIMFADYLAVDSANGRICVYGTKGEIVQPISLGFEFVGSKSGASRMLRSYRTWIGKGAKWRSPEMVICVGEDYRSTIARYRAEKGISEYKSLGEKLGLAASKYYESPMVKFDMKHLKMGFSDVKNEIIDKLAVPAMIHLVAFQYGGHDESYPTFIPPDPEWGNTEEMADMIEYAQSKGNLVIPYTNFSWWDSDGPILSILRDKGLSYRDIAVHDKEGAIKEEYYGDKGGYVVNQFHPFVESIVREQHKALTGAMRVDGVLEDQWGARSAPLDFNPAGLVNGLDPSTQYFMGVIKHHKEFASSRLLTECGVDVLADDEIGFAGTNYLWDLLGYREHTAPYSEYYPMAGMLLRDKVLLYQHDLAPESWTKNKSMLRWNLAMGYNLSGQIGYPWLTLTGIFQKYLLSKYTDKLVIDYSSVSDSVKVTDFGDYKVYSNWDDYHQYVRGGYTIAPGGVMASSADGSVLGGVFTGYNGYPLDLGEHCILQIKTSDGIHIYHPADPETDIYLPLTQLESSRVGKAPVVRAYKYDGTLIKEIKHRIIGDTLRFRWLGTVASESVGYYKII